MAILTMSVGGRELSRFATFSQDFDQHDTEKIVAMFVRDDIWFMCTPLDGKYRITVKEENTHVIMNYS